MWCSAVTRFIPGNSSEFRSQACKDAEQKEVTRLRSINVWLEETVREWSEVCQDEDHDDAMRGRIFLIMGERMLKCRIQKTVP